MVIDYEDAPGYATAEEAIEAYLDSLVSEQRLSREQAQVLARALIEEPTRQSLGAPLGQTVSEQSNYTVSVGLEDAGQGTMRVGNYGLECARS
ncbi:hypothetical protein [Kineococcus esterisolvens]|uniref:hypothetical protein n=1 Tax=unclassified Kineococcus TaxID=2621656 RepID=UPI003D7E959C